MHGKIQRRNLLFGGFQIPMKLGFDAISIDVARIKRLIVHTGVIDLAGIHLQKTTIDTIDIAQASIPKINLRNVGISKAVIGGLALSSQCRN